MEADDAVPRIRNAAVIRAVISPLVVLLLTTAARADDSAAAKHLAAAKDAYDHHDFAHARDELLAAYDITPDAQILFALGQVEYHVGNYDAAIDYYTRFVATNPPADQVALAQQAIGAARAARAAPRPAPPKVTRPVTLPPHREWDGLDTALLVGGGAALVGGGVAVGLAVKLADDGSGTLHSYDRRLGNATLAREIGIGAGAVGAVAIGVALLRWRIELVPTVGPERVGIAWEHPL
jgi:tetratricopeptide (TPR) repeat protein